MIKHFFSKNLSSFTLIKNTSLVKIFNYPINYIALFFLLYYFDEDSLAAFILLETLTGIFMALFFASQNTITLRELIGNKDKNEMIFSIVILKFFLSVVIFLLLFILLNFFKDQFFINYTLYEILYLLSVVLAFNFLSDLLNFFSLFLISLKKYLNNFFLMLVLPISGIISISITYLYVEKLDFFLTLRLVIPLLIFSLIFFYLVLSKRAEIFSLVQVNKNSFNSIKKIISLQAPIMPASFFSVAAVSFPVIIFGYQQNFYNVILLGFLDRFFNPFRNAFQTVISNLHPYLFGILSKNQSQGNKELNRFSNIFLVISFFVSLSSIFFFFIFSKLTDYEPSLGLLFIFILKFISIMPLVTQMLCNVDFYSERDTVLISKLTFSRSLINLLNFYFYNFGIQWVIFIQLISSSLPSLYSSRLINLKNDYFNKLFFLNLFIILLAILISLNTLKF